MMEGFLPRWLGMSAAARFALFFVAGAPLLRAQAADAAISGTIPDQAEPWIAIKNDYSPKR
jgi:hypothetical protein